MSEISEKDFVGSIVTATCEEISEKRVIARFDENERVFCARSECPVALKVGDKFEIYIEGITKNDIWAGSIEKMDAMKIWLKIEECQKNESDIDAIVVASEENGLICDVNSLLGFMPRREIEESPNADLNSYIGQTFKSRIIKYSAADGNLIISHKAAVAKQIREERETLLANLKADQTYEGVVKQIEDYGVFVDIGAGVRGLVHRSNLSWGNETPESIVKPGQPLKVVVLSVENDRIALGHKQLTEDTWAASASKLEIGSIVEGTVTSFTNFGAYVRINDAIEGLIHNSELSWNPAIRQAQQVLQLNDVVKVKILDIVSDKRRLSLSLRSAESNPWQDLHDKYPENTRLTCPIVGIADFGIFVKLDHDLRGLVHKNELPKLKKDETFESVYAIGQEIECVMLEVDVAKGRASLSVRKLAGDPFAAFAALKPVGRQYDAEITRLAKFGAFAAIRDMEGVEGLIRNAELSDKRVESPESVVTPGQSVRVTVISFDQNRNRLGLSLIAEPFDPEAGNDVEKFNAEESTQKATLADIFPSKLH